MGIKEVIYTYMEIKKRNIFIVLVVAAGLMFFCFQTAVIQWDGPDEYSMSSVSTHLLVCGDRTGGDAGRQEVGTYSTRDESREMYITFASAESE